MKKLLILVGVCVLFFVSCDAIFNVFNNEPIADAGADQTITLSGTVYLDGSGSSDPEGETLTFAWTFLTKPLGSNLTNDDISYVETETTASFVPDVAGEFVIQLEVNDGFLTGMGTGLDTVTITVLGEVTLTAVPGIMEISLSWNADVNAESYKLYWGESAADMTTAIPVTGTSYTFSVPEAYVEYFFTLTSVYSDSSESDPYNTVSAEATVLPGSLSFSSAGGPEGGPFDCIVTDGTSLFASTETGYVFMSNDGGGSWTQLGEKLDHNINDIALSDSYLFAVTTGQYVYRINKTGGSWTDFTGTGTGLEPDAGNWTVNKLYVLDEKIYVALHRETNVLYSSVDSASWSALTTNDIYNSSFGSNLRSGRGVYNITGDNPADIYDTDYIFIGTDAVWETTGSDRTGTYSIFAARADGTSTDWTLIGEKGTPSTPGVLVFTNQSQFEALYAGSSYAGGTTIYGLADSSSATFNPTTGWNEGSASWTDLTDASALSGSPEGSYASGDSCYIITSTGDLARESHGFNGWTEGTTTPVAGSTDVAFCNTYYYVTSDSGIYTLGSFGGALSRQRQPLATKINDLAAWNGLIAVAAETGLHFYDPEYEDFTESEPVIEAPARALEVMGDNLYVGDNDGNLYVYTPSDTYDTYSDGGFDDINGLGVYNDTMYVFTYEDGIYTFNGSGFNQVSTTGSDSPSGKYLGKADLCEGVFYIVNKEGAGEPPYAFDPSTNSFDDFNRVGANSFAAVDGILYTSVDSLDEEDAGVYKATLPGTIFSSISTSWDFETTESFFSLITDGKYLYTAYSDGAVYRSDLDGSNPVIYETGLDAGILQYNFIYGESINYNPLLISGGKLYIGTVTEGLYIGE